MQRASEGGQSMRSIGHLAVQNLTIREGERAGPPRWAGPTF